MKTETEHSVDSVRPHRRQSTRLPVPGILQARTLEWVAISFSSAWKWKVKVKSLSHVGLFVTPWTAAYQAPLSMGFSRQEYCSELYYFLSYEKAFRLGYTSSIIWMQIKLFITYQQGGRGMMNDFWVFHPIHSKCKFQYSLPTSPIFYLEEA